MSQTPLSQKRVQFSLSRVTSSTITSSYHSQNLMKTPTPSPAPSKQRPLTTPKSQQQNNQSSSDSNAIRVGIRVRPLSGKERSQGYHDCTHIDSSDPNNTQIWVTDKSNKTSKFHCDFIITDQTSVNLPVAGNDGMVDPNIIGSSQQQYVYECMGKPLLERAFDGYNASIFAYGQTGSGKTYSMIGTQQQPGLIPRFIDDLFERKLVRDEIVSRVHVEVSYYEIYNEKIYDLLRSTTTTSSALDSSSSSIVSTSSSSTKQSTTTAAATTNGMKSLQIRENPTTGPYIVDLLTLPAQTADDAKLWLDIGNKRRATACTNMNQKSSRSHSVFQITLTQMLEHKTNPTATSATPTSTTTTAANNANGNGALFQLVTSRINLVDLAGSERINNAFANTTGSMSATPTSSAFNQQVNNNNRFKESTCINKSLLTLGKIICLLSERHTPLASVGNQNNQAMIMPPNSYLPYRESVLTWLLKESLGGNAKTAMLATVNASSCYIEETMCTLRYAAKTACIKNAAHLNRNFRKKCLDEFGREIEVQLMLAPMECGAAGSQINDPFGNLVLAKKNDELQRELREMEREWRDKLEEAERLKQKEINELEKSLLVLYENETCSQACCLINLNEDPSLSGKLIYQLKSDSTLIGSDKSRVNIHLTGPLIAPVHARLYRQLESATSGEDSVATTSHAYYLEQLDEAYVTYLNGDLVEPKPKAYALNHCDRIIFGGSHFFRFNNPKSISKQAKSSSTSDMASSSSEPQFKDYQFAKNEIERKQNEIIQARLNEALSKCKLDGDQKLKQLEQRYQKDIESYIKQLEKEKSERKAEREHIKTESKKMLNEFMGKKMILETKLGKVQNEMSVTQHELERREKELAELDNNLPVAFNEANLRTPSNSTINRLINKLHSTNPPSSISKSFDQEVVRTHANANSIFAITLRITEANKICSILGYEYEFKRHEIPEISNKENWNEEAMRNYIQTVSVLDRKLNLITLWNLDTFEYKLSVLRDIYNRYTEEGSMASVTGLNGTDNLLTDSMDEWQTLESFNKNEMFSPRVVENAIGRNNLVKNKKRRLSMISSNSRSSLSKQESTESMKSYDSVDAAVSSATMNEKQPVKRKLIEAETNEPETPSAAAKTKFGLMTTPFGGTFKHPSVPPLPPSLSSLSAAANSGVTYNEQLVICNSFVYATCRDALNDEDIEMDEDDEFMLDFDDDDEEVKSMEFPTSDDMYLKYYARLVYNLKKLMENVCENDANMDLVIDQQQQLNGNTLKKNLNNDFEAMDDQNDTIVSTATSVMTTTTSRSDHLTTNNDQPLYCMKIIVLYSHLSQFRPDYWTLVNGENQAIIRRVYSKIKKILSTVKDSINCLFQSIENNIESMAKSKYEFLLGQIMKLIFAQGEFTFLSCSNTFLNRNNYSLNMIDSKFLFEYSYGIDRQFEEFILASIQDQMITNFRDLIKILKDFWNECKRFREAKLSKQASAPNEQIIDYCNYFLQTHFRLSNAFKLYRERQDQGRNYDDKILAFVYNIITDSLALIASFSFDDHQDDMETTTTAAATKEDHIKSVKKTKWNDLFVTSFKELKRFLRQSSSSSKILNNKSVSCDSLASIE